MRHPVPTNPDRAAALNASKEARKTRAEAISKVTAGELAPSKVIAAAFEDKAIARMRPEHLARAIPGIGPARAAAIISHANIASTKRLGGLGKVQKAVLSEELDRVWEKEFE